MTISENSRRNLERYLSYLDTKIDLEEKLLTLVNDLKDDPYNSASSVATKEPITKVLLAYQGAREYLLDCFPELIK